MKNKIIKAILIIFASSFVIYISLIIFCFVQWKFFLFVDYSKFWPKEELKISGIYQPKIVFYHTTPTDNNKFQILPIVLSYRRRHEKAIAIKQHSPTLTGECNYDEFDHIQFESFKIKFESGKEQIIIDKVSPLYEKKCKVSCNYDPHYQKFMKYIKLDEISTLEVYLSGKSILLDGTIEPFEYSRKFELKNEFGFRTYYGP